MPEKERLERERDGEKIDQAISTHVNVQFSLRFIAAFAVVLVRDR
jgi:hypothetical protein